MSRKDPPRGPKALREKSPTHSSSHGSFSSRPPSAPRGLTNGPSSTSTVAMSHGKPNGQSDVGRYFDVPTAPAALKNKLLQTGQAPPTGPRRIVIPLSTNTANGGNSGKDVLKISANSSQFLSAPPPPAYDPPPPPPPAYDPPPPPPPTSEPPVEPPAPPPPLPDPEPEPPVEPPLADVRIPSPSPPPPPASPPPRSPSPHQVPLPPDWPPPPSEFGYRQSYKVLFDPYFDKDYDGKWKDLVESLRAQFPPDQVPPRIRPGPKGRDSLLRYEGERFEGIPEIEVSDPRKRLALERPRTLRPGRDIFHEVKYEYDSNSVGPPPATGVLITNISPLTPSTQLRRHFEAYGMIKSFEPQIDMETGGPLGMLFIRFSDHEEAKRCLANEHGRKNVFGFGLSSTTRGTEKAEDALTAVFDPDGNIHKAVIKGLVERRRQAREEKRRREKEKVAATISPKVDASSSSTPVSAIPSKSTSAWRSGTPSSSTPVPSTSSTGPSNPPRPHPSLPLPPHLPPNPNTWKSQPPPLRPSSSSSHSPAQPSTPASSTRPNDVSVHAEPMNPHLRRPTRSTEPPRPNNASKGGSSYVPPYERERDRSRPLREWEREPRPRDRRYDRLPPERSVRHDRSPDDRHWPPSSYMPPRSRRRHYSPKRASRSRSPSPTMPSRLAHDRQQDILNESLARNGYDYIKIEGNVPFANSVEEDDVRNAFVGFKIDKVYHDRTGWFVTFNTSDGARRAISVPGTATKKIANHTFEMTVHSPPPSRHAPTKSHWTDDELIAEARSVICKELVSLLQCDISEHIIEVEVAKVAEKQYERWKLEAAVATGAIESKKTGDKYAGFSFKKRKTQPAEEPPPPVQNDDAEPKVEPMEDVRPTKRRKTSESIADMDVDRPLEGSQPPTPVEPAVVTIESVEQAISQDTLPDQEPERKPRLFKKLPKQTSETPPPVEDVGDVEPVQVEPLILPSPSPTPAPVLPKEPVLADPIMSGLSMDDEDMYFARLALSQPPPPPPPPPKEPETEEKTKSPSLTEKDQLTEDGKPKAKAKVHLTGSARSEGYYKISHTEKASYVDQYQTRTNVIDEHATSVEPKHVVSSRSNRANARRRAQGLEEHHQLQLAVALSKGEATTGDLSYKFNQLQTRKKHLRFARSPIHDWGLYAMEKISRGEMVIEYVGEVIRAQVAEKREKAYERQGIGSSYLFRIDEDLVVDATKKGNLGRLINHSCDPNCTAKIITIQGVKKIVIYAKQDIELGDEITYDYHFPIEQDKIPCLCGSAKCRGYLN